LCQIARRAKNDDRRGICHALSFTVQFQTQRLTQPCGL
jgi:hypothetical protein